MASAENPLVGINSADDATTRIAFVDQTETAFSGATSGANGPGSALFSAGQAPPPSLRRFSVTPAVKDPLDTSKNTEKVPVEKPAARGIVPWRPILRGPTKKVTCVAISRTDHIVAIGHFDGEIAIWDLSKDRRTLAFQAHSDVVNDLELSDDGRFTLSGGDDTKLVMWNTQLDQAHARFIYASGRFRQQVLCVSMSADRHFIVAAAGKHAEVWTAPSSSSTSFDGDRRNYQLAHSNISHEKQVRSIDVSRDGRITATGSDDRTVKLSTTATGETLHVLEGHIDFVLSVRLSEDASLLVTGDYRGKLVLWNVQTGVEQRAMRVTGPLFSTAPGAVRHRQKATPINSVRFSRDNKAIIVATGNDIEVWSTTESGSSQNDGDDGPIQTMRWHSKTVTGVCINSDLVLVSGSFDCTVKVWRPDPVTKQTSKPVWKAEESLVRYQGHTNAVRCLAIHANLFASGGGDNKIKLWRLDTCRCQTTIDFHTGKINCLAFEPNGRQLISAAKDKHLCLWDCATGELLQKLSLDGPQATEVKAVAFNSDGTCLFVGDRAKRLVIYRRTKASSDFTPVAQVEAHKGTVLSLAVNSDDRYVVSGSSDMTVRVWESTNGISYSLVDTLKGHTGKVRCVAITSDTQYIVSASMDRTIRVWSFAVLTVLRVMENHIDTVHSLFISADNQHLFSASSDKTIKVWSMANGECVTTLEGHRKGVNDVVVSRDGLNIISGSEDSTVHIWSLGYQDCFILTDRIKDDVVNPSGRTPNITAIALSGDTENRIAVQAIQDRIKLTRIKSDPNNSTMKWRTMNVGADPSGARYITSLAITDDGRRLVAGSEDKCVYVWDLEPSRLEDMDSTPKYVLESHLKQVTCVAVSPDGHLVVSGSQDLSVMVWCPDQTQTPRHILRGHTDYITAVSIDDFGRKIVSCSEDNTVRLWRIDRTDVDQDRAALVRTLEGHSGHVFGVCISGDGSLVASAGDDKTIKIWETHTGVCARTLLGHAEAVTSLAFSEDATELVSGSRDKFAIVWNVATGRLLARYGPHQDAVSHVALAKRTNLGIICAGKRIVSFMLGLHFSLPNFFYNFTLNPSLQRHHGLDSYSAYFMVPFLQYFASIDKTDAIETFTDLNPNCPLQHVSWLLEKSVTSQTAVQATTDLILKALKNTNLCKSGLHWSMEAPDDGDMLRQFSNLFELYPIAMERFFMQCPLIPASDAVVQGFDVRHSFASRIEVCGSDYTVFPVWYMWRHKEKTAGVPLRWRKVGRQTDMQAESVGTSISKAFVVPFRGLAHHKDLHLMQRKKNGHGKTPRTSSNNRVGPRSGPSDSTLGAAYVDARDRSQPSRHLSSSRQMAEAAHDLLTKFLDTGRADVFAGAIPQALNELRWASFGARKHNVRSAIYFLSLVSFVALGFFHNDLARREAFKVEDSAYIVSIAVAAVLATCTGYFALYVEFGYIRRRGWRYFRSKTRCFEVVRIGVEVSTLAVYFLEVEEACRLIFALGSALHWIGLLFHLLPYSSIGLLVRMVFEVVRGVGWFWAVLVMSLLAVSNTFYLLLQYTSDKPGYDDIADVMLTMFNMLLLGDLATLDVVSNPYDVLMKILFVLSVLLVPVVLLNLLIALMNDSYEMIQDRAVGEFQRSRAKAVRDYQMLLTRRELLNTSWFPTYLHVLKPKRDDFAGGVRARKGVLKTLRREVQDRTGENQQAIEDLDVKIQDMQGDIEVIRSSVTRLLEHTEARFDDIRQGLQHVRNLVQAEEHVSRPSVSAP